MILKALTRLSAIYGTPRDRAYDLMVVEWQAALAHLWPDTLNTAVSRAARSLKFFPTPAEILALVESDRELPRRLPRYSADMEPPFKPTEEELARVSKLCAVWREKFADKAVIVDRFDAWAPASQGGASPELKALVAKQRGRKAA